MAIEWDETVETKRRVRLAVDPVVTSAAGYGNGQLRHATVDDLRRACEAVGLVVETREAMDNWASAVHDAERDRLTCLDALSEHVSPDATTDTPRMTRPSSVLAGIRSLQGRLRDARSDLREHDAALEAAVARRSSEVTGLGEQLAEVVAQRDDLRAKLEKAERLHSEAEAQVECRSEMRYRIASLEADLAAAKSEAAEAVENRDKATERLDKVLDEVRGLQVQLAAAQARIAELEEESRRSTDTRKEYAKLLTRVNGAAEMTGVDLEQMAQAYSARIAELEAPFVGEPGPEKLDALWETARGGDHTRMLAIWRHGRRGVLDDLAKLRARIAELEFADAIMTAPDEVVDAELRSMGVDPDALSERTLKFVCKVRDEVRIATDEELATIGFRAMNEAGQIIPIHVANSFSNKTRHAGARAIAQRVRLERSAELAELRARIAELEGERDAAIGDVVALQPADAPKPNGLRDAIDTAIRMRDAEAYDAAEARNEAATCAALVDTERARADRAIARIAELEAPMPEATITEIVDTFQQAERAYYRRNRFDHDAADRAGALAVAERVRRERCLIARAVAGGLDVHIEERTGGAWEVEVTDLGRSRTNIVPAAEVPAELARMLTEVGA